MMVPAPEGVKLLFHYFSEDDKEKTFKTQRKLAKPLRL